MDFLKNDVNVPLSKTCLEPACGQGHLSRKLEQYYDKVVSTDLIDRGYGKGNVDFLKTDSFEGLNKLDKFDIITNPLQICR